MNRVLQPRRLSTVSVSVKVAIESMRLATSNSKINKKDSKAMIKSAEEE